MESQSQNDYSEPDPRFFLHFRGRPSVLGGDLGVTSGGLGFSGLGL